MGFLSPLFDNLFRAFPNIRKEDAYGHENSTGFIHRSPVQTPGRLLPKMPGRTVRAQHDLPAVSARRAMTLHEMSKDYEAAAVLLRRRLRQLRLLLAQAQDPEEIWHIKRRIGDLTPMLTQMNELKELTEHYYDRGYYRSEKYTL